MNEAMEVIAKFAAEDKSARLGCVLSLRLQRIGIIGHTSTAVAASGAAADTR
jgi:hypothetical protein